VVTPAAGSAGAAAAAPREREREEPRGGRPESEIFEQGRQAGQAQLRAEFDDALAKCRGEIARALQEFVRERQSYYRRVEGEVVQLALAIARKILHREVQIDPQALAGIVRVTLEKLETGTQVTLHVPPAESAEWRRYFACQTEDTPAPEIREEAALAAGECRLETAMGSTEVGLQAQLKEIETGLLDLLAERPGVPAPNPTPKPIPNPIR
jgi:flagellar assembly protein FliH